MKFASIVRHIKTGMKGVVVNIKEEYAEIIWMKEGMYNSELVCIKELKEIK
jgi:hypothetical protein